MTIYYVDPINGNDTNDGLSWATAFQTLTKAGSTATSGDEVRVRKSGDPELVGNATWTNGSRIVTLQSAVTTTIENCETAWVASANVTCSTTTTRKQGSYAASIAIGAAFTTGKVAYKTLPSTLDLSSYQKISFWFYTTAAIADSTLKIALCSDTSGDTIVDTFQIPAISGLNRWTALTLERVGGGNLGSSINSIALYADADPGTPTIYLDNIFATTANGLNLLSLISKLSQAQGGSNYDAWFAIKYVDGVAIELDTDIGRAPGSGGIYVGATETVATYKREPFLLPMVSAESTNIYGWANSGTLSSPITVKGGFNVSTNTQDGETIYVAQNGYGKGLRVDGSYVNFDHISIGRCTNNLSLAGTNIKITNSFFFSSTSYNLDGNTRKITFENSYQYFNGYSGNFNHDELVVKNSNFFSSANFLTVEKGGAYFENCSFNSLGSGVLPRGGRLIRFKNCTFQNNARSLEIPTFGIIELINCLLLDTTEVYFSSTFINAKVYSHNHDQTPGNYVIFTDGGQIHADSNVVHSPGISWRFDVLSTNRSSDYPLELPIAKIAVNANQEVTVKGWFRRNNTSLTMRLVMKGGQIAGVPNDVVSEMTAPADTWEELSVSFTPTENGVVEIFAQAWGGTTYSGWVDDLTIL